MCSFAAESEQHDRSTANRPYRHRVAAIHLKTTGCQWNHRNLPACDGGLVSRSFVEGSLDCLWRAQQRPGMLSADPWGTRYAGRHQTSIRGLLIEARQNETGSSHASRYTTAHSLRLILGWCRRKSESTIMREDSGVYGGQTQFVELEGTLMDGYQTGRARWAFIGSYTGHRVQLTHNTALQLRHHRHHIKYGKDGSSLTKCDLLSTPRSPDHGDCHVHDASRHVCDKYTL